MCWKTFAFSARCVCLQQQQQSVFISDPPCTVHPDVLLTFLPMRLAVSVTVNFTTHFCRYVLHEQAQSLAKRYRILSAVNTAIERNGVKVMILLRLSPLVPFSGFNFIAGLTKVSLRDYLLGTVGIIPGTLAFVYIGASTAGTMNEEVCYACSTADGTACMLIGKRLIAWTADAAVRGRAIGAEGTICS